MEWLLTTVLESAVRTGVVERNSLAHLCIDSTVMEKNIAHPTDSRLLEGLRVKLVDFVKEYELSLRQSYSRQGPRLSQQVGRYAHLYSLIETTKANQQEPYQYLSWLFEHLPKTPVDQIDTLLPWNKPA